MIYLDNAATTWPKPPVVAKAMAECLTLYGANPGRGGHSFSLKTASMVTGVREKVALFFGSSSPRRWIFTGSATEAANAALFGCLKAGDHVVSTTWEHNAVARPLHALAKTGVDVTYLKGNSDGVISAAEVATALRSNTKLVAVTHASNVTGMIQPVEETAAVCRARGIPLFLDAAQTAGVLPIDVEQQGVDILVAAGHKGLLGPPGIGLLYVGRGVRLTPWKLGGTGHNSHELEQPELYPDFLESGTLNTPGIAGLGAALDYLIECSVGAVYQHELALAMQLVDGLRCIPGVTVYGWNDKVSQVPVVSCSVAGLGSTELALILDQSFQIACRAGLHCAPLAHQALQTIDEGLVRLSVGFFNTRDDITKTIAAIREIAREVAF